MIAGIILIFAVPMVLAALLISPTGFHDLIHGLPLYAFLGLILPIVGWRTFLIEFALPRGCLGRFHSEPAAEGCRNLDDRSFAFPRRREARVLGFLIGAQISTVYKGA